MSLNINNTRLENLEYIKSALLNFKLTWGDIEGDINDQLDLNAIDSLLNYYLKSELYTRVEVDYLLDHLNKISLKVVDELPEEGETNIIYLVPKEEPNPNNVKDEYIWLEPQEEEEDGSWEHIGTTEIKFEWGAIEGDIEDQEDLKEALDEKADSSKVQAKPILVTIDTDSNDANKVGTTVEGEHVPVEGQEYLLKFTKGTIVDNLTLSIDGGNPYYILSGGTRTNANRSLRILNTENKPYAFVRFVDGAFLFNGISTNTTYTIITETEIDEGVSITLRSINGEKVAYIINKAKQNTIDELLDDALNLADLDNYDPNKVFNIQLDNGEIALEEVI